MTSFEIVVILVLIAYGIICAGLFNRTKINKSCIEVTNKVLDCHNLRIDGVVDRMDCFVKIVGDRMDELSKEKARVDKKVGVGKWLRFSSDGTYGVCDWYGCSICHNKAPKTQHGIDYFSPYCPACGTKMELESEVEK